MFQTDINHWLQSLDNPFVYWLLNIISLIGFVPFLLLIVMIVLAGVHFRYGMIIINFLGWTVIVILLLKEAIGYPRPLEMDSTLKNLLFLPDEVVNMVRSEDYGRSGFPSGHVAFQTSIWIGLALLLKRKGFWIAGIIIIVLTMISRLYLSHHFLADVLAGLVIGLAILLLLYWCVIKLELDKNDNYNFSQNIFFLFPLLLVLLLPLMPVVQLGRFIGLNLGFLAIIWLWSLPQLHHKLSKRIFNVLLFIVSYFIFFLIYLQIPMPVSSFLVLLITILFNLLPLLMATAISKKIGLIGFTGQQS